MVSHSRGINQFVATIVYWLLFTHIVHKSVLHIFAWKLWFSVWKSRSLISVILYFYRPQTMFGDKVMFLHLSVCPWGRCYDATSCYGQYLAPWIAVPRTGQHLLLYLAFFKWLNGNPVCINSPFIFSQQKQPCECNNYQCN